MGYRLRYLNTKNDVLLRRWDHALVEGGEETIPEETGVDTLWARSNRVCWLTSLLLEKLKHIILKDDS